MEVIGRFVYKRSDQDEGALNLAVSGLVQDHWFGEENCFVLVHSKVRRRKLGDKLNSVRSQFFFPRKKNSKQNLLKERISGLFLC